MKFIFHFLFITFAISHRIIKCNHNIQNVYQIKSTIETLGQQPINVEAVFSIHCEKKIKSGPRDLLLFKVGVNAITFKQENGVKQYPRKVDGYTAFSINRKGEIEKYYHLKDEDPIVTSIKKSFVTFFAPLGN